MCQIARLLPHFFTAATDRPTPRVSPSWEKPGRNAQKTLSVPYFSRSCCTKPPLASDVLTPRLLRRARRAGKDIFMGVRCPCLTRLPAAAVTAVTAAEENAPGLPSFAGDDLTNFSLKSPPPFSLLLPCNLFRHILSLLPGLRRRRRWRNFAKVTFRSTNFLPQHLHLAV